MTTEAPGAVITGEIVLDEWRWAYSHLVVAARHAFSTAIRMQLHDDAEDEIDCEPDINDEEHSYYCAGVVWESVKRHFSKNDRVINDIQSCLLDKGTARMKKLPTGEIDSRCEIDSHYSVA